MNSLFFCRSSFFQVHYGCHPQQIVMTDPTVCTLYDTRSQGDGVDLFEVPSNRVLHSNERLITSIQSRDFTHYVLAHHTLLGIDERYPKLVSSVTLPCYLVICLSVESLFLSKLWD